MTIKLEILKVLVLSNSHVKKESLYKGTTHLTACGDWGAYFYVGDAGYVTAFEDPEDYPPDLYHCLLVARDHDCDEVKFDADGPVMKGLPTYEW